MSWARVLVLVLAVVGCQEDAPDPNIALLAEAKTCLANAGYVCAIDNYKKMTPSTPEWEAEKYIGIAMAELGGWLKAVGGTVVKLADLVNGLAEEDNSNAPAVRKLLAQQDNLAGDKPINRIIYGTLNGDWLNLDRVIEAIATATTVATEQDVRFESLPFVIGDVPLVVFSGAFRAVDMLLLHAWLEGVKSSLAVVLALDFDLPIGDVVRYGLDNPNCDDVNDPAQARRCAADITAFAINNSDALLKREPTRGEVFQDEALEALARFYEVNRRFLNGLKAEAEGAATPATDRVLRWQERGDNRAWIQASFTEVELDADEITQLLDESITLDPPFDATPREVRFAVDTNVRDATDDILGHLRDGDPAFIPADVTVLPTFATASEVFLQSSVLVSLTQVMISAIDPEFAEVAAQIFLQIQGLYSDLDTADAIHTLFLFLFPESLEVDYRALLASEDYVRNLMPDAVTTGVHEASDLPTWEWLLSWECADEDIELLGCVQDADLTDTVHFSGTSVSLPADGVKSRVGYVGYSDPSLGGLLRFNPSDVDGALTDELKSPDRFELNALIQEIGNEFIDRLEE